MGLIGRLVWVGQCMILHAMAYLLLACAVGTAAQVSFYVSLTLRRVIQSEIKLVGNNVWFGMLWNICTNLRGMVTAVAVR